MDTFNDYVKVQKELQTNSTLSEEDKDFYESMKVYLRAEKDRLIGARPQEDDGGNGL